MGSTLFERLMIIETVKCFTNSGLKLSLWYWRSHDGRVADLILQARGKLVPIEIQLTATPKEVKINRRKRFCALAGEEICEPGVLVCRVPAPQPLPYGVTALP